MSCHVMQKQGRGGRGGFLATVLFVDLFDACNDVRSRNILLAFASVCLAFRKPDSMAPKAEQLNPTDFLRFGGVLGDASRFKAFRFS